MTLRARRARRTMLGMARARIDDYTGAGSRLELDEALALDDGWGWQLKIDGCYARVTLDDGGRVARVQSRSGELLPAAAELRGIVAGPPGSVLHGELEAHTEAGIAAAARRGWAALHLFDVTQHVGVDVGGLPYAERYALLHRGQALLETDGPGRVRSWSEDERGAAHDAAGRYCRAVPRDLRRFPIVPLVRGRAGRRELWRSVELQGAEGAVAVRLDAKAGARAAKRKVKVSDTIDGLVVEAGREAIRVRASLRDDSGAGPRRRVIEFVMPGRAAVGEVVEVRADGWYATGLPRFPRLVRSRPDLAAAGATLH